MEFEENQFQKEGFREQAYSSFRILAHLFDDYRLVERAHAISGRTLKACSCRMSEIAREMTRSEYANYKCIERFVSTQALKSNLWQLHQEDAPFLIGDPMEMLRSEARKTDYVGTLSDGPPAVIGCWFWLPLSRANYSVPFCKLFFGIPCHRSHFSKPISLSSFCRNERLFGRKTLGLDREFSYLDLMQAFVVEEVNFVIRLKLGTHRDLKKLGWTK